MREIAAVDSDPSAFQRSKFQELGVIARHALSVDRTEWRLHNAEHDCHIRYAAAHRPGRILAVGDRNDAVSRSTPHPCPTLYSQVLCRRTRTGTRSCPAQ